MAEYIEREALNCMLSELEELARKRVYDTPTSSPAYMRYVTQSQERAYLKNKISELPAEDVAPVVHGQWIEVTKMVGVTVFRCSVCGKEHPMLPSAFCRDCGSQMEEAR